MNKEINKTELKKVLLFFNSIKNEKYCIIKKPSNFPYLLIGSDLDIIVENIDLFEERFNDYFENIKSFNTKKTARGLGKIHFDIYHNNNLLIRFDVYFHKHETGIVKLKNNFYENIFNNTLDFEYDFDDTNYKLKVPELKFEILIRIIEISIYPEKVHHRKFLKENLKEIETYNEFINFYVDINIANLLKSNYLVIKIKNFKFKIRKRLRLFFLYNKLFEYIFLRKLSFRRENEMIIDIGWMKVLTTSSIIIPIDKIRVNLKDSTEIVKSKIEDTPHFKFIYSHKNNIKTNKDVYQDYLIENFSEINTKNIKDYIYNFISLYESYENNPEVFNLIVYRDKDLFLKNHPTLLDGVHRLSIMKVFNQKFVKCFISDVK